MSFCGSFLISWIRVQATKISADPDSDPQHCFEALIGCLNHRHPLQFHVAKVGSGFGSESRTGSGPDKSPPKSYRSVTLGLADLNPLLILTISFFSAEIVKETCSGELEGPQLVRYRHQLSNMYICFSKKGAVKAVVST
jgi:hypothetical protein